MGYTLYTIQLFRFRQKPVSIIVFVILKNFVISSFSKFPDTGFSRECTAKGREVVDLPVLRLSHRARDTGRQGDRS